jgi:TolB protein
MSSLEEGLGSAGARNDPLYEKAVTQLQAGEWKQAIEKLETLQSRYPDEAWIARRLDEARMKAKIDVGVRVRPRRSFDQLRPILVRVGLLLALVIVGWWAVRFSINQLQPLIMQNQLSTRIASLLDDGRSFLEAGNYDEAEERFREVLALRADNQEAQEALRSVEQRRGLAAVCGEAKQLAESQSPDDWTRSRELYQDLLASPGFCDARAMIDVLNNRLQKVEDEQAADAAFAAGDCVTAVASYRVLRQIDPSYQKAKIEARLFDCYRKLGRSIVDQSPPALERIAEASSYFSQALELRPRDAEMQTEQRRAGLFLAGRKASEESLWEEAARRWETLVQERAGYLGGTIVPMLYDAYIRTGDQYNSRGDCGLAYDFYLRAKELPGIDVSLAINRFESVRACLTPTPTPTITPTITPIPTPTAYVYVPPTPIPSATVPPPLAGFRGKIVFRSAKPGYEGFWAMNPDGSNKVFIGNGPQLEQEHAALWEKETYSPDGKCRVYATKDSGRGDAVQQIYYQCTDTGGNVTTTKVTNCSKLCYDPIWAPDGSRFVYVSQDRGSDDIWSVEYNDYTHWNYTPNEWEWDKHPSFSPDGRKIVFWSNREGTRQIFVMDANGQNLKKISGDAPWDEFDPIWVR